MSIYRTLNALMGRHRMLALMLLLSLLTASIAEGIGFSLIIPLVDLVTNGASNEVKFGALGEFLQYSMHVFSEENRLVAILLLLMTVFFIKSATLILATVLTRYFVNTLRIEWVTSAFKIHLNAPYVKIAAIPQGTVLQNIAGETDIAAKGMLDLIEAASRALQIMILFGVLLLVNWQVTLALGAFAVLAIMAAWRSSGHFSISSGRFRKKMRQEVADIVAESIIALRAMKLLDLVPKRERALRQRLTEFRSIDTRFEVWSSLPSKITDFVAVLIGAAVILTMTMALSMPMDETLPLVALFGLVFLRLAGSASFLFSKRMQIVSSFPSLKAVASMIGSEPEQSGDGITIQRIAGDIEFRGIHLTPSDRSMIFDGLDITVPQKGLTAIIGPSGAGKTTLMDFLVRLRTPDSGTVFIDGIDLMDLDVKELRKRVSYVSQEPQLFYGTVADNIRLGREDATDDDLVQAAIRAHAHDFISSMPENYNTHLGRGAVTLSGGQKQRLALARELVRDANLYIFDEPTSALDKETSNAIAELMEKLSRDHPVIVITHQPEVIVNADVIYRLEAGKAKRITSVDMFSGARIKRI